MPTFSPLPCSAPAATVVVAPAVVSVPAAVVVVTPVDALVARRGPAEHEVLEQVGEAARPGVLVGRAHVVPETGRDHRMGGVGQDAHFHPVRQDLVEEPRRQDGEGRARDAERQATEEQSGERPTAPAPS